MGLHDYETANYATRRHVIPDLPPTFNVTFPSSP